MVPSRGGVREFCDAGNGTDDDCRTLFRGRARHVRRGGAWGDRDCREPWNRSYPHRQHRCQRLLRSY